ncbi:MAG: hemolysin family protein [Phycisphaerales bacterium]|nr:hemolysin family protein [Phycisphaerales bacterium]
MLTIMWAMFAACVLIGAWLSTIERAMTQLNKFALQHEFELKGSPTRGIWIATHFEHVIQSIALFRVLLFLTSVACLMEILTRASSDIAAIMSFAIAGLVYWLCSSMIAGAIAVSVPFETVQSGWLLIRCVSLIGLILSGVINVVQEIVRRLTGANLKAPSQESEVEEQLLRSIEHSQREGGLPAEAAEMLENVVDLGSTDVGEIMTPRTDIVGIELTDDLDSIRSFVLESGRSRIPVFEENLDQIVGILYVKDLIEFLGSDINGFNLRTTLRKPIVVPDTKLVQELLADFQTSEVHMAVVIDEYGGTAGLVTIEDVLEEIVGEIRDEHDDAEESEPEILRISEVLIEVDGRFNLDDINDELNIELPEDEEYDTIAGYILANLGHVPQIGETLEIKHLRFTALKATSTQIERVSIEILENSHS